MKKRSLTVLLTAALGMATAQTTTVELTTAPVTVNMGNYTGPLSSLLAALSKAAGYEIIIDGAIDGSADAKTGPARPVVANFEGKPFNEVWPLLMDVHGLSFEVVQVGNQKLLRVTSSPIQKVIKLENANAADVVNQIKLFFGTPQYSEIQQKDAQGNVVGVVRTVVDVKLDSATLRIVPDTRNNTLVVRGTNREIDQVANLVVEMDRPSVVTVTTTPVVQRVYAVKGAVEDITALLSAQYPNLRVTSVGKSGQLVLTGPSNQMDAALGLLAQVDKPVVVDLGPAVVQRVFTLSYALATEVEKTLEDTLSRELNTPPAPVNVPVNATGADGSAVTVTVPSAQPQVAAATTTARPEAFPGASIIADERTNSLIVRGSQRQVDQIAELIPLLDQRVPQINVQVRIQEINESAARNLGIDWSAGIGNFTTKIVSGGLSALFDSTRLFSGFNLGAALNALESQGLSKNIYDGAVTLQSGQRRQGNQGSTETASAASAATIKSGGRLEVNIPSSSGNIQKQIDYGVLLDFLSPQVSPDGRITVGVKSNVSNLATSITGQTIPNVLQFVNKEAQTTVSFKSGETVMLGGLLTTEESQNREGVPFLSSIPVIGNLFSKTINNQKKSQLLIVITGNVVD